MHLFYFFFVKELKNFDEIVTSPILQGCRKDFFILKLACPCQKLNLVVLIV